MIYLNEIDPFCVEWLRNLIKEGHLPDGIVDDRSIEDVTPADLKGFDQCHFFAGIGLWPLSLHRAGVPSTHRLWTGSCPCQPFSAAGEGKGFADERHLWPAWNHLIGQCRPELIFGEQVASKDGLGWFDLVSSDLEGQGYAIGANDLCAAGFGAFHIRQRLWFVAVADALRGGQSGPRGLEQPGDSAARGNWQVDRIVDVGGDRGLADADRIGRREVGVQGSGQIAGPDRVRTATEFAGNGGLGGVGDSQRSVSGRGSREALGPQDSGRGVEEPGDHRPVDAGAGLAFWMEHAARDGWKQRGGQPVGRGIVSGCGDSGLANADGGDAGTERQQCSRELGLHSWRLWPCQDGKYRPIPVEPAFFPLAHGHPGRVGQLRAYGNGIHVETATCFIEAALT